MAECTTDVVVVGMGPGGEAVANRLAKAGVEVVGIEANLLGGECPYWGCIPSKMMLRGATVLHEAHRVAVLAGSATVEPDWSPVAGRIRDEATDDWDDRRNVARFERNGGRFVRGRGRLVARDRVAVGDDVYRVRRGVVIATGTTPAVPPIPGLETVPYWTNHEAAAATSLPRTMLILGGGPIGVEFAQGLAAFGVTVTLVESAARLLPGDEPEAGTLLAEVFATNGIDVRTGARVTAVEGDDDHVVAHLDGAGPVTVERLLVATGRRTDVASIGAAEIGVDTEARFLPVDEFQRVVPGVWAVGDIVGKGAFTHVALQQAQIVVDDLLGREPTPFDERAVPRVTFTDPEVGAVGWTEAQAREQGIDVVTGTKGMPDVTRGWIHGTGNEGFIKVVLDRARRVLVGATAMGPHGGEVLGHLALAVHAEVRLDVLRSMIYAYPTYHRGIEDALRHAERVLESTGT